MKIAKKWLALLLSAALLLGILPMGLGITAAANHGDGVHITVDDQTVNGTVTADRSVAAIGDVVTLTVTPDAGATLSTLTVFGFLHQHELVETTAIDSTHFSFTVPEFLYNTYTAYGDIWITASFYVGAPSPHYFFNEGGIDCHYSFTFDPPATGAGTPVSFYDQTYPALTSAYAGDTVTFTITPDAGYEFPLDINFNVPYYLPFHNNNRMDVPCPDYTLVSSTDTSRTYTFTMPDYDIGTKYYAQEIVSHRVDVNQSANGTVTSDHATAFSGATVTLTATPDPVYEVGSIHVYIYGGSEVPVTAQGNGVYTFTMPAADVYVNSVFQLPAGYYRVDIGQYENGAVASDYAIATAGTTVTLTATPDPGYEVGNIDVYAYGGGEVPVTAQGGNVYTFIMPADHVYVKAGFQFPAGYYRVDIGQYDNGAVASDYVIAPAGTTVTLTATPDPGYEVENIDVYAYGGGEVPVTAQGGNVYTFTMPADHVYVKAGFLQPGTAYRIDIGQYENGTIASDYATAPAGTTVTLTALPSAGYFPTEIHVYPYGAGEVPITAQGGNTFTFTMPADDVYVKATFKAGEYTVTIAYSPNDQDPTTWLEEYHVESVSNGGILGLAPHETVPTADTDGFLLMTANPGETVRFSVTPMIGYKIDASAFDNPSLSLWQETSSLNGRTQIFSFTMPANNVEIKPLPVPDGTMYHIDVAGCYNGTIEPDLSTAHAGETVTLTLTPDSGHVFGELHANDALGDIPLTAVDATHYTFEVRGSDVTITGGFKWNHRVYRETSGAGYTALSYTPVPDYYNDGSVQPVVGSTVTVHCEPNPGAELFSIVIGVYYWGDEWYETNGPVALPYETIDDNTFTFVMPNEQVVVFAEYSEIFYFGCTYRPTEESHCTVTYTPVVDGVTGVAVSDLIGFDAPGTIGTVTPAGQTVTYTVTPDAGYTLDAAATGHIISVDSWMPDFHLDNSGPAFDATLVSNDNGVLTYSFVMPEYSVCFTPTLEIPEGERNIIVGTSLLLEGLIGVNVYMEPTAEVVAGGYAVITGPNDYSATRYFSDLAHYPNGYRVTATVCSPQMTDAVTVKIYNAAGELQPIFYNNARLADDVYVTSVASYCERVFASPTATEELRQLASTLYNYGAYAQILLEWDLSMTTDPAAIADVEAADLAQYEMETNGEPPAGFSYYGMSLVLREATSLRIYFSMSSTMPTITLDGTEIQAQPSGSYYYVELSDIASAHLDTPHVFNIGGYEITVSALSWAYNVLANRPDVVDACNVAKAIYLYNQAANVYFGV